MRIPEVKNDEEAAPLLSGGKEVAPFKEKVAPKEQNSWWATGVQIMNSMLGSGILAFPYTLAKDGAVLFTFYAFMVGVACFATSYMMISCGKRRGIYNFSELSEATFGSRVADLLKFSISISSMGSLLSYLNVIGSLGAEVVNRWSGGTYIFISSYAGFMILAATLVLPLILFRTYGELTHISIASLVLIIIIVIFVLIEGQVESSGFSTAPVWPETRLAGLETLGTFSYSVSARLN